MQAFFLFENRCWFAQALLLCVFLFPLRVLRKQEEDEWGEGKEKGKSKGIIFFFPECIYSRKQPLDKMSRR